MYAIETELGRFEADTEAGAKKLLRAARRKAAAARKEAEAQETLARSRAREVGYLIYYRIGKQRQHHVELPGVHFQVERLMGPSLWQWRIYSPSAEPLTVRTQDRPVAIVTDAGGYTAAVLLRDEYDGGITCHALGVAGKEWSMEELPGVTPAALGVKEDLDVQG